MPTLALVRLDHMILAAALFTAMATSCRQMCTEMGCAESFAIDFRLADADSTWPAGTYDVAVAIVGEPEQSHTCHVTLPLDCNTANTTCDGTPPFHVIESGCALDPSSHAIGGIYFLQVDDPNALLHVRLDVFHEGNLVGSGDYEPEFEVSYPNGEDCGPRCVGAGSEELVVTFAK